MKKTVPLKKIISFSLFLAMLKTGGVTKVGKATKACKFHFKRMFDSINMACHLLDYSKRITITDLRMTQQLVFSSLPHSCKSFSVEQEHCTVVLLLVI